MRKTPSPKTLKRLFALSGNLCAFPKCTNNLVDHDGNLIGQVCHIEAAEDGGERYNKDQSEKERASFENLILLCANHHITTNDVSTYTTPILKKMKAEHEGKFIKNTFTVSEEIIEKALAQLSMTQQNTNAGTGQQINNQAQQIVIHSSGVSVSDVISITNELFEKNFPKLVAISKETASKNVAKFEKKIREEITQKLSEKELERFSDPDIQMDLYQAIQASARKDSEELRDILANLIVQRVKNDENDLKQKVLNETIATIHKITADQMKIITTCFIFKNTSNSGIKSWEDFKGWLEKSVKPFIDFKATRSEILHLQYAGCGKVSEEAFITNIVEQLRNQYSYCFLKGFEKGELDTLGLPEEVKSEILHENSKDGKFYIRAINKNVLKEHLSSKGVIDHIIENTLTVYEHNMLNVDEVQAKIESEVPWMKQVLQKFKETLLNQLTLTSVGQAIAISYFENTVSEALDMNIWIN